MTAPDHGIDGDHPPRPSRIDGSSDPAAFDSGAFVPGPRHDVAATGSGPLDGLRFAVKDLIDTAGTVTGAGNPDWARTHTPARTHAEVVARLLAAGASVDGRTITDELAFSLEGENQHFGTPRNPRAPDRLPGGSSSGSAVAVAAELVDFALGTDTGGSVRVPASFCGLYGMRPTHGSVSMQGVVPFAPTYDTVGWLTRSAALLQRVGGVLLSGAPSGAEAAYDPTDDGMTLHIAADAFDLCDRATAARLRPIAEDLVASSSQWQVFDGSPQTWFEHYATLQGADILATLGPWIDTVKPRFGSNIAPRFAGLHDLRDDRIAAARAWRLDRSTWLKDRLGRTNILVLPSAPCPALTRDADGDTRGAFYPRALALASIAGHAGLPQITLPLADLDGLPVGLSLIGPPGSDLVLLALACRIEAHREASQ